MTIEQYCNFILGPKQTALSLRFSVLALCRIVEISKFEWNEHTNDVTVDYVLRNGKARHPTRVASFVKRKITNKKVIDKLNSNLNNVKIALM